MNARYQFRNLTTGKPCCTSNDIRHLCGSCAAQARHTATAPAPTVAAASDVPPPPALADAIAHRRNATTRKGIPLGTVPEPVIFGGGPRPRPTVAASAAVDDPPSLTDAIARRRNR